MDLQELYKYAVNIIQNNINAAGGNTAAFENSSLCVIFTQKGNIYTGLNGTQLENGVLKSTCPEYNAITSMMMANETRISKMITVLFKNYEVVPPCEECRKTIQQINAENLSCEIAVSKSEMASLQTLIMNVNKSQPAANAIMPDMNNSAPVNSGNTVNTHTMSDFWVEPDENTVIPQQPLACSSSYVTNVAADENNPFYEPPSENKNPVSYSSQMPSAELPPPQSLYSAPNSSSLYVNPAMPAQNPVQPVNAGYAGGNPYSVPVISPDTPPYYNPYAQQQPSPVQQPYPYPQQNTGAVNTPYSAQPVNSAPYGTTSSYYYNSPVQNNNANPVQQPQSQSLYYQAPYNQQPQTGIPYVQNSSLYVQQSAPQPSVNSTSVSQDNGNSIYKQRLSNLLNISTSVSSVSEPEEVKPVSKSEKNEMIKSAKEKKKLAKIDAKFAKKARKKGF